MGEALVASGGVLVSPGEALAPERALERIAGDEPLGDPLQPECQRQLDIASLAGAQRPGTIASAISREVSFSHASILLAKSARATMLTTG